MKSNPAMRALVLASALLASGTAAFAQGGDVYSRLAQMRAEMMKKHADGMVSKAEYLDMVSKAWDMQAAEMQVRDGKMTPEQVKALEKLLGRMLGS